MREELSILCEGLRGRCLLGDGKQETKAEGLSSNALLVYILILPMTSC
jgi:hypothetical protein